MGLTRLNQLGEWNPQLFRELKGQLKHRNVFSTVASSLTIQLLMLVIFSEQHCPEYRASDCDQLIWDIQWHHMFRTLNWLLPFLALFVGTYLLISDLGKEEHRGTLNFIRLSPQSSQSILIGKMLGVPALLYLGLALVVPLHWISALASGVSLYWILSLYTLWGAGCCLFYSCALLMPLLYRSQGTVQAQAWAGGLLAALCGLAYISVIDLSINAYRTDLGLGNWQWFFFPLGQQPVFVYAWTMITVSTGTYWIWQSANRIFRNPKATLLSKQLSYWLVGSIQVWLLGFVLPALQSDSSNSLFFLGFGILFVLNPLGFLILTAALSPNRQALQDWVRYRRDRYSTRQGMLNRSLMQDLIWGEKSPALVAIAINLLIVTAVWVAVVLLVSQEVWQQANLTVSPILLGLLLTVNVILIYAAIAELMLFVKKSKQTLWVIGVGGTVVAVSLFLGGVQQIELITVPFIWLFSPLPVLTLAHASVPTIFLGLLAQWSVLALVTLQLTRHLQKAGESTSKALFAHQEENVKRQKNLL